MEREGFLSRVYGGGHFTFFLCPQGMDVTDEELLEYISESSTMSKAMDEYDGELILASAYKAIEHCLKFWSPCCADCCRWL